MPQQDPSVIKSRAAALRQAAAEAEATFLETRLGAIEDVLLETGVGHTAQFAKGCKVITFGGANLPRARAGHCR